MEGLLQRAEVAGLIPPLDLDARVVYVPIRHHSPACAQHVARVIEAVRPDAVLIEGPRDATPLIPLLTHPDTRMPVAIFTTFIRRARNAPPAHFAAYYPFCDFSPELAALRAAAALGVPARFIDLTFPEQVVYGERQDGQVLNLLEERYFAHSRFLRAACQRAGARDPDDLWDQLYEDDGAARTSGDFLRNVLAYCALARQDCTTAMLDAEGALAREGGMAAEIARETGRVVVVTGGFHTVALPATPPQAVKAIDVAPADAQVVLTRYSFPQLDRLNGYASGMPSPEFYQRAWDGDAPAALIVALGRRLRARGAEASTADEIAALAQAERLARLRGHLRVGREDLLDGIRSSFIKGAEDIEGVAVLTEARTLLAGTRVGAVPADAGQPPIVHDFRDAATRLHLRLDGIEVQTVTLDLYRKAAHRDSSRLLHRLCFLEVPFAELVAGPDFVAGTDLERVQEVWRCRWSPLTESTLIERAMYGATLEEAAAARLLEAFGQAGQGGRAGQATALVLQACRMGLHRHTQALLDATGGLIAQDNDVPSLVMAASRLHMLHVSREPLEAHDLAGLEALTEGAVRRACFLLPTLGGTAEEVEDAALDALNALARLPGRFAEAEEALALYHDGLAGLADAVGGNPALRGGAVGLLTSEGAYTRDDLVRALTGHLWSARADGADGIRFLRGLLRTARGVLWQTPEIVAGVTEVLLAWDEEQFLAQLPRLRLAFADLTPRECDRLAGLVAGHLGLQALPALPARAADDLRHGAALERLLRDTLAADGLTDFAEGDGDGPR
jgi:hypothetical protein